jgi:hypothetical protein
MKIAEGRKYLDSQRFDLADYMKNYSRERGTDNSTPNKNKLTLQDLKNYRDKSNKSFLIDRRSEY